MPSPAPGQWVRCGWGGGRECGPQDAGRKQPSQRLPWSWVRLWVVGARGAGPGSVLSAPLPSASQELFKAFARHLSHSLTQKSSPGGSGECLHHWARRHVGSTAGGSPALTLPTLTL